MSLRRTVLLAALMSLAPPALVIAQTDPQTDTTSPSSASSPHQREATSTNAPEASSTDTTTTGTSPSAASSPHQQEATSGTRTASKQSMKECISKQQADNSGMTKEDAKKACKAQLKGPG